MTRDRCSASKANLTHMFCSCSKQRQFWLSVFEILNSAFKLRINPNPKMALFGVSDEVPITNNYKNALDFVTLIARRRTQGDQPIHLTTHGTLS